MYLLCELYLPQALKKQRENVLSFISLLMWGKLRDGSDVKWPSPVCVGALIIKPSLFLLPSPLICEGNFSVLASSIKAFTLHYFLTLDLWGKLLWVGYDVNKPLCVGVINLSLHASFFPLLWFVRKTSPSGLWWKETSYVSAPSIYAFTVFSSLSCFELWGNLQVGLCARKPSLALDVFSPTPSLLTPFFSSSCLKRRKCKFW